MHIVHWWSDWHRFGDAEPIMRDGKKIGERASYRSYCYKDDASDCGKVRKKNVSFESTAPATLMYW
jgi:hypothetical protein